MTVRYIRRMNLRILYTILGLAAFLGELSAQVQVRFKDVSWNSDPKTTVVPMEWRDRDAVCLERKFTYELNNTFGQYNRQSAELYVKLNLRSEYAVETFRFIPIPNLRGVEVLAIDARITKLDGRVIDVRSKFLKRHEWELGTVHYPTDQFRLFEVPMLEAGDQFEYFIRFADFPIPERVYFHSNLPTVKSIYELIALTSYELHVSSENGAPEPVQSEEFYSVYRVYEMQMLDPLYPVEGCLMHEVYPNVRQVVEPPFIEANLWPSNWGSFYRQIDRTQYRLNQDYDRRMEETLRQIWQNVPEGEQLEKIKRFHQYVNRHLQVVKRRSDAPISFGNDMRYGQTTAKNLLLMYDDIFRRFDIPFRMIWAGDVFRGNMDTTLLSDQITPHRFFAAIVDGDTLFFTPKSETRTYSINEFPPEAKGQDAIWFHAVESFKYDFARLPEQSNANRRLVTIQASPGMDNTLSADERLHGDFKHFLAPYYNGIESQDATLAEFSWIRTRPSGVQSVEIERYTSPDNEFSGFTYLMKEDKDSASLFHWLDFYALQLLNEDFSIRDCIWRYPLFGTEEYQLFLPRSSLEGLSEMSLEIKGIVHFHSEVLMADEKSRAVFVLSIEKNAFSAVEREAILDFLGKVETYLKNHYIDFQTD